MFPGPRLCDAPLMAEFAKALPHGPLEEVFPDVFVVTGTFKGGFLVSFPRNMIVVRDGNSLSLINSVRLNADAEAELEKLGKVEHIVKIGAFHGMDDPYNVSRFKAKLWAMPGTRFSGDLKTDEELSDNNLPFAGVKLFSFQNAKRPEGALLLEREGGVLITCDSVQNWTSMDGCSLAAKLVMKRAGFLGKANFGPFWVKFQNKKNGRLEEDYRRLGELEFAHQLGGHGAPLMNEARTCFSKTLTRVYGEA